MRGMAECLPCGMFFSMQKGFTAICEAFLWCRFTMTQAARRMTQGQAACHHLKNFQENTGAIQNCKEMIHISSQFFFISQ